jgi:hypothetical protein
MIRYVLNKDVRVLYKDYPLQEKDKFYIKGYSPDGKRIFVNILKVIGDFDYCHLRLYYSDGTVEEGFTIMKFNTPIRIFNEIELYDGRFNQ